MSNHYRGPPIDAPYQAVSEEKIFKNRPISNKNCLWRPCMLADQNEMSNCNRGLSINVSYQFPVHLAKRFQRRIIFFNQPIRNKNRLWRPCLLTDLDEMSNLHRGPSIDGSYQVSIHLAEGFQRRRLKCEKLTTTDAKWWQQLIWLGGFRDIFICNSIHSRDNCILNTDI